MGADERFRRAKLQRERNEFDGRLAQSLKQGDERAYPADNFGLTIRPGVLVMHFPQQAMPPTGVVTDVQPVLDPRAPAGMLRVRVAYDFYVPAGVPNPALLVVGDAPVEPPLEGVPPANPEVEVAKVADEEPSSETPADGPRLVITDAH